MHTLRAFISLATFPCILRLGLSGGLGRSAGKLLEQDFLDDFCLIRDRTYKTVNSTVIILEHQSSMTDVDVNACLCRKFMTFFAMHGMRKVRHSRVSLLIHQSSTSVQVTCDIRQ